MGRELEGERDGDEIWDEVGDSKYLLPLAYMYFSAKIIVHTAVMYVFSV